MFNRISLYLFFVGMSCFCSEVYASFLLRNRLPGGFLNIIKRNYVDNAVHFITLPSEKESLLNKDKIVLEEGDNNSLPKESDISLSVGYTDEKNIKNEPFIFTINHMMVFGQDKNVEIEWLRKKLFEVSLDRDVLKQEKETLELESYVLKQEKETLAKENANLKMAFKIQSCGHSVVGLRDSLFSVEEPLRKEIKTLKLQVTEFQKVEQEQVRVSEMELNLVRNDYIYNHVNISDEKKQHEIIQEQFQNKVVQEQLQITVDTLQQKIEQLCSQQTDVTKIIEIMMQEHKEEVQKLLQKCADYEMEIEEEQQANDNLENKTKQLHEVSLEIEAEKQKTLQLKMDMIESKRKTLFIVNECTQKENISLKETLKALNQEMVILKDQTSKERQSFFALEQAFQKEINRLKMYYEKYYSKENNNLNLE